MVNYFHTFITFCIMLSIYVVTMKLLCHKIKMKPSNIILLFLFSSAQYFFFSSPVFWIHPFLLFSTLFYLFLLSSPLLSSEHRHIVLIRRRFLSVCNWSEGSFLFPCLLVQYSVKATRFPRFYEK